MKPIVQFKMGSSYFFERYDDYIKKDADEICIVDKMLKGTDSNVLNMKIKSTDVFFYRNMSKEEFIHDALSSNVPMRVGKFLIPEFNEFIGFKIDDLYMLSHLFHELDKKHEYERFIFESYIMNGDFTLTDEQCMEAYEAYKSERPEIYGESISE